MLTSRRFNEPLPSPWGQFLREVDGILPEVVELHCLGGFVVSVLYGLPRPTADIDFLSVRPSHRASLLQEIAGRGSKLAKKYGLYLQQVGVVSYPEDYEERLIPIAPRYFRNLRLMALEAYDLVLSKIERNTQKDREDVEYLAKNVPLDAEVLRERYHKEFRPALAGPIAQRHDTTLDLWIDAYFPPK